MNVLWWLLLAVALFLGGLLLSLTDVFQIAVLGSAIGMLALLMLLFGVAVLVALIVRGLLLRRHAGESRRDRMT